MANASFFFDPKNKEDEKKINYSFIIYNLITFLLQV